jgi:hypothetical protein
VAAAAAVVVAVMAGLGTAGDLPTGGDQTVTGSEGAGSSGSTPGAPETATPPAPPEEAPCGTELPFELPAPASYEGPFPGPSDRVDVEAEMSPDTVQLHWRSAEGTIDVRWPSFPPLDPTTPYTAEPTSVSESYDRADGGRVREARVATTALGAGQCVEMGVIVTSDDPQVVERTLDQIEIGLVGPGGVLPSPAAGPLVAGTLQAAALPEVVACPETNQHSGGPVDDAGTHPTPREALAFFLVTEPVLSQWGYEEISLPDGSRGYALDLETFATGPYRPDEISDATDQPTTVAATVVHVVPQGDGWTVTSWRARAC